MPESENVKNILKSLQYILTVFSGNCNFISVVRDIGPKIIDTLCSNYVSIITFPIMLSIICLALLQAGLIFHSFHSSLVTKLSLPACMVISVVSFMHGLLPMVTVVGIETVRIIIINELPCML